MKKLTKEQIKKINKLLEESKCVILATDQGACEIGTKTEIMSAYTMLIGELRKECDLKEEDIKLCYKLSKLTSEDIKKETQKTLDKLLNDLKEIFNK